MYGHYNTSHSLNMEKTGKRLFVVGTGTDVGKTYISGLLLKRLCEYGKEGAYYKAAMSGNEREENGNLIPGDALFVKNISGMSQPADQMCPYVYEAAVSPHLAAKMEGTPPDMSRIMSGFHELCSRYEYVTLEGSGGIVCPLRYDQEIIFLEDVVRACHCGTLLVADAGLGTINAVVLTVDYMRRHGLSVKGIIFNRFEPGNEMHEDNKTMCEKLTGIDVIACVRENDQNLALTLEQLDDLYDI